MLKKLPLTDGRWDEAVSELQSRYEPTDEELRRASRSCTGWMEEAWRIAQENHEPKDDDVWELLAEWNDAAYDDYADSLCDQIRDERG